MSNSWYFRMPIPMHTGRVITPAAPRIWITTPQPPGKLPVRENPNPAPAAGRPGQQPLQLVAAFPRRPPVAQGLPGQRGEPAREEHQEEEVLRRAPPGGASGRVFEDHQVPAGIDTSPVGQDRRGRKS